MSILRPRPVLWNELEEYESQRKKFLCFNPCLNGDWQITGLRSGGFSGTRVFRSALHPSKKVFFLSYKEL